LAGGKNLLLVESRSFSVAVLDFILLVHLESFDIVLSKYRVIEKDGRDLKPL
jgi:hypothetical protein